MKSRNRQSSNKDIDFGSNTKNALLDDDLLGIYHIVFLRQSHFDFSTICKLLIGGLLNHSELKAVSILYIYLLTCQE